MHAKGHGQAGPTDLTESLERLKPHDHLCLIYESPEEWRAAVVPFIRIGLERGEKCMYVVDKRTADEVRRYLANSGVDVPAASGSGQLSILKENEAYTQGGTFDPDRMIALLIEETQRAVAEGYPALRITGEMTWVLRGTPGAERVLEYEAKLNRDLFPHHPCLALCQYDRWAFDPEIIKGVVMTHPILIRKGQVHRNFYYIPPKEFLNAKRAEREVQHWLNSLERERESWEKLRENVETLAQERERINAIMEATHTHLNTLDADHKLLYVDDDWQRTYGDPQGRKCFEYFMGLEAPCPSCGVPEALNSHKVVVTEQYLPKEDRVFEVHTIPFQDANGAWFVAEFNVDITERKRVEDALEQSEAYNAAIVEAIPDLIILRDRSGTYLDIMASSENKLALPAEALLQKKLEEVHGEADASRILSSIRTAMDTGTLQAVEYELKVPAGRRWFEARMVPMENEQVLSLVRDITERKQAEQKLEDNEARLQSLVSILQYQGGSEQEFLDYALDEALKLTESTIGYLYFYSEEKREFTLNSWSKGVMDACSITETQTVYQLETTGIWGEAVRQRKEILVNDFQAPHPLKKGYPEGHAPLYRYLTVPVFKGDQVVAVVGVANKATDYGRGDVLQLQLLMDGVWKEVERRRGEAAVIESVEAARQSEARHRQLFEESPVALLEEDFSLVKRELDTLRASGVTDLGAYFKEHPDIIRAWVGKIRILRTNHAARELFAASGANEVLAHLQRQVPGPLENVFRSEFIDLFTGHTGRSYRGKEQDLRGNTVETLVRLSVVPGHERELDRVIVSIEDVTEQARAREEVEQSYRQVRNTFEGTVDSLSALSEIRDPYTAGHQRRVARLACAIAERSGMDEEGIEGLRVAALLHDIGKVAVAAEILNKPTQLSELEFSMVQEHPKVGSEILQGIDFPWPVAQIVLQHHERLDGSGYPQGLKGDEALTEGQILAVADVVEAMASHRPYRPALGVDTALAEIREGAGTRYNEDVVATCVQLFAEGFVLEDDS